MISVNSTSINPTHVTGLLHTLSSASSILATAHKNGPVYTYSQYLRGASASLNAISAESVLATATASSAKASASAALRSAALDLAGLEWEQNQYTEWLTLWPNALFTGVFGFLLVFHFGLTIFSRYWYFGTTFVIGTGLCFGGYLARSLSVNHESEQNPFLVQIIVLTIAPAFLMAGVYYILGKMLVLHGPGYSTLRPKWFSYIFVSCDLISLIVQAVGGAMAADAVSQADDTAPGTHVMVAGIAFQVVSMSFFLLVFFEFVFKLYFRCSPDIRFSFGTLIGLFFDTKRGRQLRPELDAHYIRGFESVRQRQAFSYVPLAVFASTVCIYIRCIYRLVELAGGWRGYVITHEAFLMSLDALQVAFSCFIFILFHPYVMWGPRSQLHALQKEVSESEKYKEEAVNGDLEEGDGVESTISGGSSWH
ncbi:putative sphingoid long-chain base transporter [Clavispora lusitaniae]|nr:putative sphingoid long-chain base transporter [Clavispora lusitaniae]